MSDPTPSKPVSDEARGAATRLLLEVVEQVWDEDDTEKAARIIQSAIDAEREACAAIADQAIPPLGYIVTGPAIARAIRSRK